VSSQADTSSDDDEEEEEEDVRLGPEFQACIPSLQPLGMLRVLKTLGGIRLHGSILADRNDLARTGALVWDPARLDSVTSTDSPVFPTLSYSWLGFLRFT
jgi:hypothetical protein